MSEPWTDVDTRAAMMMVGGAVRALDDEASECADPLDRVRALSVLEWSISDRLRVEVAQARAAGASWTDIGQRLGVSKQAAQQRYGSG